MSHSGYYASTTGAVEDQGIYMSGDFGYVMMGATDGVVDGMDTFMTCYNVEVPCWYRQANIQLAGLNGKCC